MLSRPTQKDIASRAGVSQGTVSLALRNHPGIPAETAQLVHRVAKELGYAPDPYLAGLSSYRRRIQQNRAPVTIAWLSNDADGASWKTSPAFAAYHAGAVERARQLGYSIEEHYLQAPGMSARRMETILCTRNIQGLILPPQPTADVTLEFNFEPFAAVTLGYTLIQPRLNVVAWHQCQAMETAFRRLVDIGYRRIGLAMSAEADRHSGRSWSTVFWSEQRNLAVEERVAPLVTEAFDRDALLAWVWENQPDVVIGASPEIQTWLEDAGLSVPDDIGFCLLSVPEHDVITSGFSENARTIGSQAVEMVVDMMHAFERGVPPARRSILIDGKWQSGQTLRRAGADIGLLRAL